MQLEDEVFFFSLYYPLLFYFIYKTMSCSFDSKKKIKNKNMYMDIQILNKDIN